MIASIELTECLMGNKSLQSIVLVPYFKSISIDIQMLRFTKLTVIIVTTDCRISLLVISIDFCSFSSGKIQSTSSFELLFIYSKLRRKEQTISLSFFILWRTLRMNFSHIKMILTDKKQYIKRLPANGKIVHVLTSAKCFNSHPWTEHTTRRNQFTTFSSFQLLQNKFIATKFSQLMNALHCCFTATRNIKIFDEKNWQTFQTDKKNDELLLLAERIQFDCFRLSFLFSEEKCNFSMENYYER